MKKLILLISVVLMLASGAGAAYLDTLKIDFDRDNATSPAGWEDWEGVEMWSQGNQNVIKTFGAITVNIDNNSGTGQLAIERDWEGAYNPGGALGSMADDALVHMIDGGSAAPGNIGFGFTGLAANTPYKLESYHTYAMGAGYGGVAEPVTLTVGGVAAGPITPDRPVDPDTLDVFQSLLGTFTTDGTGAYSDISFTAPADSDGGEKKMHIHISGIVLTEIPEPATMLLLGLGGMALIRRKRI